MVKRDQRRPPVSRVCRKLGVAKLSDVKTEKDLYDSLLSVIQSDGQFVTDLADLNTCSITSENEWTNLKSSGVVSNNGVQNQEPLTILPNYDLNAVFKSFTMNQNHYSPSTNINVNTENGKYRNDVITGNSASNYRVSRLTSIEIECIQKTYAYLWTKGIQLLRLVVEPVNSSDDFILSMRGIN